MYLIKKPEILPRPKSQMASEGSKEIYDAVIRLSTSKPADSDSCNLIESILTKAYDDRIKSLKCWVNKRIFVGINFNTSIDFNRQIEPGPHHSAPEAKIFRDFWGDDKSKLTRFQDGSLLESVKWGENPIEELALFALKKHFDQNVQIEFASHSLNPVLSAPHHNSNPTSPVGAYDELVQMLMSLPMTVKINSISPRSQFIRGTAVFPYEPYDLKSPIISMCPYSIKLVARLEQSDAWPQNLQALLQFKIAVYIEMAKKLKEKNIQAKPHYEGIHILFRGFVFDIIGFHPEEIRHFYGQPHSDIVDFTEHVELVHHSYITALKNRFTSFSEATRAAIRWVRAKGVPQSQFKFEAIELMMAYVYTSQDAPSYGYCGLLRFLRLLETSKEICLNDTRPAADTENLPFIVVSTHCIHSEFTQNVSKSIITFLKAAAKQSLGIALDGIFSSHETKLKQMFAVPTSHWKIKIFLNLHNRPHNEFALFTKKRETGIFEVKTKNIPELDSLFVDFDPVNGFVTDLAFRFGKIMNFWYDDIGGIAIGISFQESLLTSKPLKEENLKFAIKTDEDEVNIDMDSIIEQINVLGGDLIKSIERKVI